MPANPRAIFLSYASQDADVAKSIAGALRAANLVVWLDQSELRGGDAWDAHIQRQINICTLFVPIISARSQGRREGYFRLEWRLADERLRRMAMGTPFLLPVAVDDLLERDAIVPRSFLEVQWARLPQGEVTEEFVRLAQQMLVGGTLRGETLMYVPTDTARPRGPAPGDRSVVMSLRPGTSREPTGATLALAPVVPPAAVSAATSPVAVASTDSAASRRLRLRWVLVAVGVICLVAASWAVIQAGFFP